MSVENAKAFIAQVKEDAELRGKYEAAENEDARASVREAAGFTFSVEDFKSACSELGMNELSDEDLDKASGGDGFCIGHGSTTTCNTKFW